MTAEHIFRRIPHLNLSLGMSHFSRKMDTQVFDKFKTY